MSNPTKVTRPQAPVPPTAAEPPVDEALPTSTYPLDQLLQRWRRAELTADQMIGHLLQHVTAQDKRLRRVEMQSLGEAARRE